MDPKIQYAKTEDGVSIAYYAIGQGPPTLYLLMPQSHLEAEWQIDAFRIAFTAAALTSFREHTRGLTNAVLAAMGSYLIVLFGGVVLYRTLTL